MYTLRKILIVTLSFLLINAGGTGVCLADKKGSKQLVATKDELAAIRQQVEKLSAKNKVRIQLKSEETLTGKILQRNQDRLSLQTGKAENDEPREVLYSEIKTIQPEEKLGPGIKVLGVVVVVTIIALFAVVTHHRQ